MATPAGSKITPIASGALIVIGVVIAGLSLLGGGAGPPAPSPVVATAPQDLTDALAAAKKYLTKQRPNSYTAFGVPQAEGIDPSLTWVKGGPVAAGKVTIRPDGGPRIVLVTKDAATGTVYCIADVNGDDEVSKGKVDAKTPKECTGGW
ncbi:MAG: hypothetical protein WD004_04810 [Actinomycetota bacterium]